ncbi:orotidine 5'-phosphate decarboxylase [Rickettsiales bacterium Ac37b]|nr:orotidine 5'-phosphate decarboxylase [Rickettsiales bacterium Ac37b]
MLSRCFTEKFLNIAKYRGPFCLGIDPTSNLLLKWGLKDNVDGLRAMCDTIVKAAGNNLAIVKPQAAYFERFGPEGMQILRELVEKFHAEDTLVLLDAKRGDINSTSLAYAEAYLGENSIYKFDAMTFTAYLGFDALLSTFEYAHKVSSGIFLVIKSSNPEGAIIQDALTEYYTTRTNIAEYLAMKSDNFNQNYLNHGLGPIGAVVGATLTNIEKLLSILKSSLILMPGIGYQGAIIEDLFIKCAGHTKRIIPIAAREILDVGNNTMLLTDKIKKHCEQSFKLMHA